MKTVYQIISFSVLTFYFPVTTNAQIRVNDPGKVAERQAEYRTNRKIDQAVDKGFDKMEEGIGSLFKKKDKKLKEYPAQKKENTEYSSSNETSVSSPSAGSDSVKPEKATLKSYSKFDFISGEKVVAIEDFSQDAVGDFPAKWNTNSSGEVVTIDGAEGKWLMLGPEGVFYPEFVTKLPENFTLEFNLATTSHYSYYSGFLRTIFAEVTNPANNFSRWKWYDGEKMKGLEVGLHPNGGGSEKQGMTTVNVFGENPAESVMKNDKNFPAFTVVGHNSVKVSIWRQKSRLRLYVDNYKVWDLPRAFNEETNYNFIAFSNSGYHEQTDRIYISNLRLAVGAPDIRSKLITEGKFSTNGILFDINSTKIKPESYGILKDIANALAENATVKIKIIGHTDSDGDDQSNLSLSKKRSESVRETLIEEFGIDNQRLETDGKGEGEPLSNNTSFVGKANNRRVEFVKL